MELKTLPKQPELVTIRIIADIQTGQLDKRVMKYLLEDYNRYEYLGRVTEIESLSKEPFEHIFSKIEGYTNLTDESKNSFLKTIIPFLQCQGKVRLTNTSIHHIEDKQEANGIRVYLTECGSEAFQFFLNGNWG
jgi:hypothetical protein